MAQPISDEAFARAVNQMGAATLEHIETARVAQIESAKNGVLISLADAMIQLGMLTPIMRESIEKKLKAQASGGIQQLGQYKLIKKLGEGGMGAVYLAEDLNVGRKVALKVLPKRFAGESEFLTRFKREAQATGKLNHVNIVAAYASGEDLGHHYYAMEYCEGHPLDSILKRDKIVASEKALEIVMQVARGLKHAHDHGFVHRDIKPGNVFITDRGVAKILDLGLSKDISDSQKSFNTQTGVALGTPHYISPEQARGDKIIDGRTDIYSLGATVYHLVTGETPFQGSTAALIMMKHLNDQLVNPQDINELIPDGVAHLIQKMMAKEPEDRYRDCSELLTDLELVIDGKMPSSHAVEEGKSSVAMRQKLHPARRTASAGTRQHPPVEVRQNVDARKRAAKPASSTPMYLMLAGLGIVALILVWAIMSGGKPTLDVAKPPEARTPEIVSGSPIPPVPLAPVSPSVPEDAWVKSLQTLPPEEQFQKVVEKLKELNTGYDGAATRTVANGAVTEFRTASVALADISPLRALRKLQVLTCSGIFNDKWDNPNRISDITPLQGLALTKLDFSRTRVADLSVLKSMPLRELYFSCTQVSDLSPIAGMQITSLDCSNNPITDLSPLRGMPLRWLHCAATKVTDLSPLHGMPLTQLYVEGSPNLADISPLKGMPLASLGLANTKVSDISVLNDLPLKLLDISKTQFADISVLKTHKSLDKINGMPVADFWAKNGGTPAVDLRTMLISENFKNMDLAALPVNWSLNASSRPYVKIVEQPGHGKVLCINSKIGTYKHPELGVMLDPATVRGRTLHVSVLAYCPQGYVPINADWAKPCVFVRCTDIGDANVFLLPGQHEWQHLHIDRKIPPNATDIQVILAVPLVDAEVFFDNLRVEIDPDPPTTQPKEISLDLGGGVKMEMVLVPAGSFKMGSPKNESERGSNETQHDVTIGKAFYMAKFPVTQEQYQAVMGTNPSRFKGAKNPVEKVSWNDATDFCSKLSSPIKGTKVTLPTEAQWEYACRAGTTTRYYMGDAEGDLANAAWYKSNSDERTHPVGEKKPNSLGLYDMQGNVRQWCLDAYTEKHENLNAIDPYNSQGEARVLRGGSWGINARYCRAAYRIRNYPVNRDDNLGFRVVVVTESSPGARVELEPPNAQSLTAAPQPKETALDLGGGVKMEMVLVQAGEFDMGSNVGDQDEKPIHRVKLSQQYYVGKFDVTVSQFRVFVESTKYLTEAEKVGKGSTVRNGKWQELSGVNWRNPGFEQDDNHPVVVVTWNDAHEFCKWATKQAERNVRLPTEAEWEYAARGLENRLYPWGDKWEGIHANVSDSSLKNAGGFNMQWGNIKENDGYAFTSPVGAYKNSASWCGAFDMAGNVWQWCEDRYSDKYYAAAAVVDPIGPTSGKWNLHVLRGGCWNCGPGDSRSARRIGRDRGDRDSSFGFRVVAATGVTSKSP